MGALRTLSRSKAISTTSRITTDLLLDPTDMHEWALAQWRSTSPWAVAQAVAALGRHHSTPWLPAIDVPTAVVVTTRDRVPAPDRREHPRRHRPRGPVRPCRLRPPGRRLRAAVPRGGRHDHGAAGEPARGGLSRPCRVSVPA